MMLLKEITLMAHDLDCVARFYQDMMGPQALGAQEIVMYGKIAHTIVVLTRFYLGCPTGLP